MAFKIACGTIAVIGFVVFALMVVAPIFAKRLPEVEREASDHPPVTK